MTKKGELFNLGNERIKAKHLSRVDKFRQQVAVVLDFFKPLEMTRNEREGSEAKTTEAKRTGKGESPSKRP